MRERTSQFEFTAVFEKVPEGYIGFVEELPGANTQGATSRKPVRICAMPWCWCIEANRTLAEETLRGKQVIREPLPVPAA